MEKQNLFLGSALALGWCMTAHAAPPPPLPPLQGPQLTDEVIRGQDEVAQTTVAQAVTEEDEVLGPPKSEATEAEVAKGYLSNEVIGIKPQIGALFFQDALGNNDTRGVAGLSLEANLYPNDGSGIYLGPSTGFFYSHLGAAGSNFVGTNAGGDRFSGDSNLGLIPVDLKVGMRIGGNVRLSARGGGNVIYRSVTAETSLGQNDRSNSASSWNIYPNVGLDLEFGPLLLRPDWTITPGSDLFTTTAGVVIPIG